MAKAITNADLAGARTWTVYICFSLTLVLIVTVSTVVFRELDGSFASVSVVLLSVALTSLILFCCAISAALLSPVPLRDRLHWTSSQKSPRLLFASAAGAPALGAFLDSATALLGIERTGSLAFLDDTVRAASPPQLACFALIVTIGPGLAEELLFRGYCQTRLVQKHGPWLGIGIASLLFGLMHADPLHSPLASVMGLYLGYVALRFGLQVSILAHMVNNLFATLSTVWLSDPTRSVAAAATTCLSGAVVFGLCLIVVNRRPIPLKS